jgi:HAL2 family 3'(2'),5'-bisphosphate nucleotidase
VTTGSIDPLAATGFRRSETGIAIRAVREAALLCRAVRTDFDARLAVAKDDRSPVTVADLGAQVLVSLALAAALPGDALMGEEDARQLRSDPVIAKGLSRALAGAGLDLAAAAMEAALERGRDAGGPRRRWWTLDPVDGTKGFLRNEQYAVALALVDDGRPQVAVLGCPNLPRGDGSGVGCLFVAERDEGAFELSLDDPSAAPRRISVDVDPDVTRARYAESVEAAHSAQDEAAAIATLLGIATPPVRMDSQAKYGVVARGEASVYLRIPRGDYRENVWDHAAGMLIVEEAGGIVCDVDGRPLDLTTGRRMTANRGVVATPAIIHDPVIAAVRQVLAGA